MAEVIPTTTTQPSPPEQLATSNKQASKPGRKSKFTASQELIIAQEVSAAEAHVALHGETLSRFEKAALKANDNLNFGHKVTGKNIQDRFKKLLDDFATRDNRDHNMSGTGGEVGELDQLLGDMLEAKKNLEAKKDGDAKEKAEQEMKKLAAGRNLILQTLKGKDRKPKDSSSEEGTPQKKLPLDLTDGMQELGSALKESERARFEREKLEVEKEDKKEERAERAFERELRRVEMQSYRQTMEKMMQDNSNQMQAVLGLVGTLLQQAKSGK